MPTSLPIQIIIILIFQTSKHRGCKKEARQISKNVNIWNGCRGEYVGNSYLSRNTMQTMHNKENCNLHKYVEDLFQVLLAKTNYADFLLLEKRYLLRLLALQLLQNKISGCQYINAFC